MPRLFFSRLFGNKAGSTPPPVPPNVPTLIAVDNTNGTGGVATITGSTAGSINTVMVNRDGSAAWTVAGSRTGDGTVALTLAKGYYWAAVNSLLGASSVASNVARLPVTDDADSVHGRFANAIVARLQSLSLPLLQKIDRHMLPDDTVSTFPCVIAHFNDGEQYGSGTNIRDDVGYPVTVLLCDRKLTNLGTMPEWYLSYRQRMQRAVRHPAKQPGSNWLVSVPEIYDVTITPMPVVDERLPAFNYFVSGFIAIGISREVRG